ncbi:SusC/RagA family TonB-linked outer membrane protein [Ferruginibacter sp. SUN106]|uniref:SusC/RagA family TonB-linked outer membrane protein n=1 Tax=Ferruginibacter sp. SUN106 TaxID=2978348 RepID=UPI003D35CD16
MQKSLWWLLVFLSGSFYANAQNLTGQVTGTVKTESGEMVEQANIQAVNSTANSGSRAVTNGKGIFTFSKLAAGGPYSFIVTAVGFETETLTGYTIEAGKTINITVTLKIQTKKLDDVVVTGYGKSSKRNVTGAITSISSENFNQAVTGSPAQLLQGKVAGLNIANSGDPNAKPVTILRGPSTLREGANEPFYVIDGVPGASIDLVAPADIATIDVLKDASSTAIYGSRAANGVIMITTKRAKQGQTRLSYSPYIGIETVAKNIDMLTGDELRGYLTKNGQVLLSQYDNPGANTNWQKEVQRTGISHNHNLSLSGSNAQTLYSASVNYFENQGIIKTTSLKRVIEKANIEQKLFAEHLKLGFALIKSTTNHTDVPQSSLFGNMLVYMPTVNVKQPDGSYTEDFSRGGYLNPVGIIDNNKLSGKEEGTLLNTNAEVKIMKGLTYTLSYADQKQQSTISIYNNKNSGLAVGANGKAYRAEYENHKQVVESYFNYDKTLGKHNVRLLAGYSWQEDRINDGFGVSTQGYTNDLLTYYNLYVSNPNTVGNITFDNAAISTLRLISYYGRVNYQYGDRYLFQASVRKDGSSAFGANNQWGYFPSVSAGWRINKESFMQNQHLFDDLKLRAGYGVSGNSLGFDAFTSILRYGSAGRYYSNGQLLTALGVVQNENPDLKWESTSMMNLGLDFSILKNRISGSIDYYTKNTSDLIWDYPVSTTQYFVNVLTANVGKVKNSGIELTLNATPVKTKNFSWNTSFNIAHNKNEVVSLSSDKFSLSSIPTAYLGGQGQTGNWSQVVKEGQPLGTFSLWHYMGKNTAGVSTFQKADGTIIASQPLTSDYQLPGNAQPKFTFGWNNTLNYKNFDFNFFIRGVYGNKILNNTLASLNNPANAKNLNIPRFTLDEAYTDNVAYLTSDRYLENGSYLRLDNATLGYNAKLKTAAISKLRFYVAATNLFTITNYTGIDPEINIGGLTPGIDNRNFYPKTRSVIIGANIIF